MSTFKYAPAKITMISKKFEILCNVPVRQYTFYKPEEHPVDCPLIKGCFALVMDTDFGARWYGFDKIRVDNSLQVACKLLPGQERDEVIAKWDDATPF